MIQKRSQLYKKKSNMSETILYGLQYHDIPKHTFVLHLFFLYARDWLVEHFFFFFISIILVQLRLHKEFLVSRLPVEELLSTILTLS